MDSSACILFVHNWRTPFVQLDLSILQERFQVTECFLESRRVNLRHIWEQVASHDLVFGWFASWHTFLPLLVARWLGKPSLLIIGGYDVANMPEIGYGHQRGGLKKWVSRWTMRLATCLISISYYSQWEAEQYAKISKERLHVVYQGIPDPFGALPKLPRERMVLTVGNVDRDNLWRKGHEPFVRAAASCPDVRFVLVGEWKDDAIDDLRAMASPNVTFTGWVERLVLLDYYRKASVYVQASLHEGFGISVAEAMLAGCIPAVTRVGALPEVVGDAGVYLADNTPDGVAKGINKALLMGQEKQIYARERILQLFHLEKRKEAFYQHIKILTK
ncbi:MAG: glycosyltransferase family 4 protein [Chloroflexi bacterium]|nr:glycosyltransferase family 4 protein [Chloroflexota bacterium]